MAKIKFEFDYYEDREEIGAINRIPQMQSALFEAYNICRAEYKHGDWEDEKVIQLLERLKEALYVEGVT